MTKLPSTITLLLALAMVSVRSSSLRGSIYLPDGSDDLWGSGNMTTTGLWDSVEEPVESASAPDPTCPMLTLYQRNGATDSCCNTQAVCSGCAEKYNCCSNTDGKPSVEARFQCPVAKWSGRLDGVYIAEGHGRTDECYGFEEAKRRCEAAPDCGAIATQSNVCGGKYRVTHGGPTQLTYGNWRAYNLWAYTLERPRWGIPKGTNIAPPPGYIAKAGSGACRCRGSGFGLDSCGVLCCAASPYTNSDASHAYAARRESDVCFEPECTAAGGDMYSTGSIQPCCAGSQAVEEARHPDDPLITQWATKWMCRTPFYTEATVTGADWAPGVTGVYSTRADVEVACTADASCKGFWQHPNGSFYLLVSWKDSGRTWRAGSPSYWIVQVWKKMQSLQMGGEWRPAGMQSTTVTVSQEMCEEQSERESFEWGLEQSLTAGGTTPGKWLIGGVDVEVGFAAHQTWASDVERSFSTCTSETRETVCPGGSVCDPHTEVAYAFTVFGRKPNGQELRADSCDFYCMPMGVGQPPKCPKHKCGASDTNCQCCTDNTWAAPEQRDQVPVCSAPTPAPAQCLHGADQTACMDYVGSHGFCNELGYECVMDFCAGCGTSGVHGSSAAALAMPVGSSAEFLAMVSAASISQRAKTNLVNLVQAPQGTAATTEVDDGDAVWGNTDGDVSSGIWS